MSEYFEDIAAKLDRFEQVPDEVLGEIVARDGACVTLYAAGEQPDRSGIPLTDRELAARICAGCSVRSACLELELRTSGAQALGVWGALPGEDVRAVHPVWQARRNGGRP